MLQVNLETMDIQRLQSMALQLMYGIKAVWDLLILKMLTGLSVTVVKVRIPHLD